MMDCRVPCSRGEANTLSATAPVAFAELDRRTDLVVALDAVNRQRDTASLRGVFELVQARWGVRLGVGEHRHAPPLREEIEQHLLALAVEIARQEAHASRIATGTR